MAAEEAAVPATAPAETAPAAVAGEGAGESAEPLVVTAENVATVALDDIPKTVKAWDPIGLAIFLEVSEIIMSRWGLLQFVLNEQVRSQFPQLPSWQANSPMGPLLHRVLETRRKRSMIT